MRYSFLTAVLLIGTGVPAYACSVLPEDPPLTLQQRADRAENVFVGKVKSVSQSDVTFMVKDSAGEREVHIRPVNNTCGVSFTEGEVWLFMGAMASSGSRMALPDEYGADPEKVIQRLSQ